MIYRLVTQQAIKKWNATDHETYPLLAEALWRSLNETPSLQSEVASILPLVGKPLFHLLSQAITHYHMKYWPSTHQIWWNLSFLQQS